MKHTLAIGVDPGKTGAIAVIRDDEIVRLADTPTIRIGKRQIPDEQGMAALLRSAWLDLRLPNDAVRCVIEDQQAFPAQGRSSCFALGLNLGQWRGIVAVLGIPYEIVRPRVWQGAVLCGLPPGDKGAHRTMAQRLFPAADLGSRKDQGRADALLIAEYARRQMVGA